MMQPASKVWTPNGARRDLGNLSVSHPNGGFCSPGSGQCGDYFLWSTVEHRLDSTVSVSSGVPVDRAHYNGPYI